MSQILNSIHKRNRFLSKTLGKSQFHFQNDRSGHGPAGQFWLLESALSHFGLLIFVAFQRRNLKTPFITVCDDLSYPLSRSFYSHSRRLLVESVWFVYNYATDKQCKAFVNAKSHARKKPLLAGKSQLLSHFILF